MVTIYRFKNGNVDEYTTIKYIVSSNGDTPITAQEIKDILDLKLTYSIKLSRIHHLLNKMIYHGHIDRIGRGKFIKSQDIVHINIKNEFPFMLDPEWMSDCIEWDLARHFIEYIQNKLHTNKCIKVYGWKYSYHTTTYTKEIKSYPYMDVLYKVL